MSDITEHWYRKEIAVILLGHLRRVDIRRNPHDGICGEVSTIERFGDLPFCQHRMQCIRSLLKYLICTWPKRADSYPFPVSDDSSGLDPCDQYGRAAKSGTMWSGKYGELRVELLHHCIQVVEQLVASEQEQMVLGSITFRAILGTTSKGEHNDSRKEV